MNQQDILESTNIISLFCRLNINNKKELPIRNSEIGLLIFCVKAAKEVSPMLAAEYFEVSKPMIAKMIKSLVKHGYIEKHPSNIDKRSYTLKPTKSAIDLTNQIYDEYFKIVTTLIKEMGQEKFEQMTSLMNEANNIMLKEKKHV